MKKSFTLVELIIVITILAILSVSAFLVVSQWIGKSRDSRRLSDLGTIQRALEVSLTENAKYPTPDSAVNITAGSIIIGQQGKFGDSARSATDIKTTPMDPLDNVAYTYYVATGGKNYQVMGFLENSSTLTFRGIESQGPRSTVSDQENLQFSNSACTGNSNGTNSICSVAFFASLAFCLNYAHASEVSAADYSVRVPTTKGETLGILILSGTNQPVEELGSTVDLSTSTSSLIAVFSNTDKSSGTGGQIISPIAIKNKSAANQSVIVGTDPSLIAYWDMETKTSTGGLMDFSQTKNIGIISGAVQVVGKKGNALKFQNNGVVLLSKSSLNNLPNFTWSAWLNLSSFEGAIYSEGVPGVTFRILLRDGASIYNAYNINLTGNWVPSIPSSNRSIALGEWYHITLKLENGGVNSGSVSYYVNGNKITTMNGQMQYHASSNYATIGAKVGGFFGGAQTPEYSQGLTMDEVRIYNRALSDSEIQSLYQVNK